MQWVNTRERHSRNASLLLREREREMNEMNFNSTHDTVNRGSL